MKFLVIELEERQGNFDNFWDLVEKDRISFNKHASNVPILSECHQFDEIEEANFPRASMRDLRGV